MEQWPYLQMLANGHQDTLRGSPPSAPNLRRPVLLATLSVRVDPRAESLAIESALDADARLVVASFAALPDLPLTLVLAREHATLPHEEDLEAVRATAQRAAERGIATELLRIGSPRPLVALSELTRELQPGLLVLGPDPKRTPRLRLWRAARQVRRDADCLVWIVANS